MEKFMKASRVGLTFQHKGTISVSDLWVLSLTTLDTLAQKYHAKVEAQPTRSFITGNSSTETEGDKLDKLRFEVLLAVLNQLVAERDEKQLALVKRSERENLDQLIAQVEKSDLASKSVEELKAMRDKL